MAAGAQRSSATKCAKCDRVVFRGLDKSLVVELMHIVSPNGQGAVLDDTRDEDRMSPVSVSFYNVYAAVVDRGGPSSTNTHEPEHGMRGLTP